MDNNNGMGLSQSEQIKVNHMSRHASGVAIGALVTAVGAAVAAVGVGAYACAKASEARRTAAAENAGTAALLKQVATDMGGYITAERAERIAGQTTISQTITDSISGQQQGSQNQSTSVENSAYATAMNQIVADRLTGRSSLDAQPVCIYSAPQPCGCPGCGCQR